MQILLVEDRANQAELLARILGTMGHACDVARNLHEALDFVGAHLSDLVITDFDLPDGNGLELAKCVSKEFSQTPVVLTTGHQIDRLEERSREAGVAGFLRKPITMRALTDAIEVASRNPQK